MGRIKEVLNHPVMLKDIVAAVNRKRVASVGPLEQELLAIENKLKQLADKKKKIMDVYEMDAMDRDTLIARMDELTGEEDTLHARRSEIAYELGENGVRQVSFEAVCGLLARLDEMLEKVPLEQKKALLRLAIQEITVKEGRQIDQIALSFGELQKQMSQEDPSARNGADGSIFVSRIELWI